MKFYRSNKFKKSYKKRILFNKNLEEQVDERIIRFSENPADPLLKDHALKGKLAGLRSFSITGDIRIVYKKESDLIILYDIGSHNQVYK
ncbi:hypothetical protein A2954_04545 [Candidatus Roizmanbacteria bacterium RIFCSPLOWO2_01_FULL_37_12]|uniref:Type II toxin-antitoxin system mRNA interferase toxin, RelE/StbE family n=1 Tax=Candidatus Roizmanbacteria bacterium RIFCSPLOWO2_01_FULL_37_12 TaxID=1802056 RepID=A0A1F7IFZ2_9BACT|nr:MAG: hypothetical protein A3D76_02520 [Candidatus Roizmanbacteria bacterium RIFCSPHIGHO2_02_FULL_37_9b]OGK42250.1 MAG: hypothetical protein A2954_04545 [Candidatus Roizmanbacteria bacterium RIFCSPLOWO2_01_FULL_37_12]